MSACTLAPLSLRDIRFRLCRIGHGLPAKTACYRLCRNSVLSATRGVQFPLDQIAYPFCNVCLNRVCRPTMVG